MWNIQVFPYIMSVMQWMHATRVFTFAPHAQVPVAFASGYVSPSAAMRRRRRRQTLSRSSWRRQKDSGTLMKIVSLNHR